MEKWMTDGPGNCTGHDMVGSGMLQYEAKRSEASNGPVMFVY